MNASPGDERPSSRDAGDPRARVTLTSLHSLRERVNTFAASGHPAGRPRRRFLAQQAAMLADRLQVILVVLTVVGASMVIAAALAPAASAAPRVDSAAIAELVATIAFALGLLALPPARARARRTLVPLQVLAVTETAIGCIALACVARVSGGGLGPYALGAPVIVAGMNAHLPLSPRVSLLLAAASYAVTFVAFGGLFAAPVAVHLLALATCASGAWLAILRHRRALGSFLRIERLSARVARLRKMQEQLVVAEKLEGLRVLVGGLSHELNNALAVSAGSVQQASRALPADVVTASAALVRVSGGLSRIRGVVDRLRRFASTPPDGRGAAGVLEAVDVGAMLDFALENAIGRARSGIAIDRAYAPEAGPLHVHVPALSEALFQVARNAVEAMPSGGTLRAGIRVVADHVVISVADEGRGIPPEEAARVFDPYYSRGGARKAGMGLSAVYGLVRSLGGTIELHSAVGQGTCVMMFLPREVSAIRAR